LAGDTKDIFTVSRCYVYAGRNISKGETIRCDKGRPLDGVHSYNGTARWLLTVNCISKGSSVSDFDYIRLLAAQVQKSHLQAQVLILSNLRLHKCAKPTLGSLCPSWAIF